MENNFRVILAKKRKKLVEIHEQTGIAMSTLSKILNERTANPDSQTLIKIAKALDVTIDELLTPEE